MKQRTNRILMAAAMLALACDSAGEQETRSVIPDTVSADATVVNAAPITSAMQPGTPFDANAIKVGDRIAGLVVASKDVQPSPSSPVRVAGSIAFTGEVQLSGNYRAHFDYPEVRQPCFWVDSAEWKKLPRARGDSRIEWFCFTNSDVAIRELGPLGSETHATIVVADYKTNLSQSDVWDQARLVRVLDQEKKP